MKCSENVIEWERGDSTITATLSTQSMITKVMKLAEKHEEVEIVKVNKDGSIVAHLPLTYLKFIPPKKLSEETRQMLVDRISQVNANRVVTPLE